MMTSSNSNSPSKKSEGSSQDEISMIRLKKVGYSIRINRNFLNVFPHCNVCAISITSVNTFLFKDGVGNFGLEPGGDKISTGWTHTFYPAK